MTTTLAPTSAGRRRFCLALAGTALPWAAPAQDPPAPAAAPTAALKVTLADGSGRSFTLAELKALPPETASARRRDGSSFEVTGVSATTLLRLAGMDLSRSLGVQNVVAAALIAQAADGYKAVFGVADVDPHFGHPPLLVTWARSDGSPLAPEVGPLQLVNTGEARTVRWVRQLVALEVRRL